MTRTRSASTRAATSRQAEMRQRPSNEFQSALYIDPRLVPKGMTYRWVREANLNQPDGNNVARSLQSGWRPVPADRHKEFAIPSIPGLTDHLDQTLIRRGGLLLCERPTREVEQERRYIEQMNDQAVNGSDYRDKEEDGVPRFDDSVTAIEQVTARAADFK